MLRVTAELKKFPGKNAEVRYKERQCSLAAQRLHANLSLCRPGQVKRSAPEPLVWDGESSESNSSDAYPCPLPHGVTMTNNNYNNYIAEKRFHDLGHAAYVDPPADPLSRAASN